MADAPRATAATTNPWPERFETARQALPVEPRALGMTPRLASTIELAGAERDALIAASLLPAGSPGAVVAGALALVLREMLNDRAYRENMRKAVATQPERIEALIERVTALVEKTGG